MDASDDVIKNFLSLSALERQVVERQVVERKSKVTGETKQEPHKSANIICSLFIFCESML